MNKRQQGARNLTHARLLEMLHYEPTTGVFTRRVRCGKHPAGAVVGYDNGNGYLRVIIDDEKHYLHRLALYYVSGVYPSEHVDHRNELRHDNRLANLRELSHTANQRAKSRPRADNKLGLLGVSPYKGRYRAQIKINGKYHCIGVFDSAQEAHRAYWRVKVHAHPEAVPPKHIAARDRQVDMFHSFLQPEA